ncbi:MAG TPA: heme lyase CcmF/NrfE family subunit, partial [Chloroflexota bacterium]|nr:heme lyase CcmF/NrfE family subunit [Chloroflexota bacterium]
MLPTVGHAAIVVALAMTLYAAAAFILGARRRDPAAVASGRTAMLAAFGLAAAASAAMMASLLSHDFSIAYVARNNATTTPPFYSVISLWAALEGSILFWALLLTGWSGLVLHRYRDRHPQLMPWVGLTLALASAFFFAVMTWPSNPFERLTPVPVEGNGPNALLQNHPFMGLHPPLLYLGYTGLAVPFAFGVAALVTGRTQAEWLAIVRRWTLIPWIFLTAGIVAGAWWSYEVLGWGGYWAWDPVENAALLPWLTATAFIHSSMVAERRGGLRVWTMALVVFTFVLTLVGTFLTRSGVVASVHAFTASAIGPWFAVAILLALAGGMGLLLWRLPDLGDRGTPPAPVSRESAFLLNNVLFLGLTFVVLFGTLLPMIVEGATGERISVGAPYFNAINAPLFAALLFLMAIGPALPWGGASWATLRDRFGGPALLAVGVTIAGLLAGMRGLPQLGTLFLAIFVLGVLGDEVVRGARSRGRTRGEGPATAAWRLATRNRRRYGGYTVHLGVLVMAIAIAVSSGLSTDRTVTLRPGESAEVGAYTVTHDRLVVAPLPDDARVIETAAEVRYDGPQSGTLRTALRDYPNSQAAIATPAVRTSLGEDLYVTLLAS